jgi:hypothetical protein
VTVRSSVEARRLGFWVPPRSVPLGRMIAPPASTGRSGIVVHVVMLVAVPHMDIRYAEQNRTPPGVVLAAAWQKKRPQGVEPRATFSLPDLDSNQEPTH